MRRLFVIGLLFLAATGATSTAAFDKRNCLEAPFDVVLTENQLVLRRVLDDLLAILADFPSLRQSLDSHIRQVCLSDNLLSEKAFLDTDEGRIVLADDMSVGLMLAILVHEIRHADQLARGICPSDDLAMEYYARATLSLEADANVVSLIVAWQQKAAGNHVLWRALEEWPMISDTAVRFAAAMDQTKDISSAATAAFEQWYMSENRRERYYVAICSDYLDRQEQAHALPRYLMLPADYFSRLCRLPDGQNYKCEEPQVVPGR